MVKKSGKRVPFPDSSATIVPETKTASHAGQPSASAHASSTLRTSRDQTFSRTEKPCPISQQRLEHFIKD